MPSYNATLTEIEGLVANLKAYPDRSGDNAVYLINLCKQKLVEVETALAGISDTKAVDQYVIISLVLLQALLILVFSSFKRLEAAIRRG